jgi:hypothetical protein
VLLSGRQGQWHASRGAGTSLPVKAARRCNSE